MVVYISGSYGCQDWSSCLPIPTAEYSDCVLPWIEGSRLLEEPMGLPQAKPSAEREFFIDNLLVQIHFIIVMIRWTGLAP